MAESCKAAAHAARRYLENMHKDSTMVKLDFSNACSDLYRDQMLNSVLTIHPSSYPFGFFSYAEPANFKYGTFSPLSDLSHPFLPFI